MLGTVNTSFFFEQKRQKRFQQRRVRKFDETERREGITFLIGEKEADAASIGAPSLRSAIIRRTSVVQQEAASEMWEGGREGGRSGKEWEGLYRTDI
jgi:hypothetical protein